MLRGLCQHLQMFLLKILLIVSPWILANRKEVVEEASEVVEEASKVVEEASEVVEEASKVVEEASEVVEEASEVMEEASKKSWKRHQKSWKRHQKSWKRHQKSWKRNQKSWKRHQKSWKRHQKSWKRHQKSRGRGIKSRGRGIRSRGRGIKSRGRGIKSRGRGIRSRGRGIRSRGRGIKSRGRGIKSRGRGIRSHGRGIKSRGRGIKSRGRGIRSHGRGIKSRGRGIRSRGRGIGSRGRGVRGHGKGASKASGRRQRQTDDFDICDLTTVDNDVPSLHQFNPSRSVGVHLPLHSEDWSPEELFKDSEIVNMICDASNEYAERNKNKYPVMYSYFRKMEPIDFYNLVGILVHLSYRKIPRARLMWSPTSLCYDPLISKVMSRNRFDSLLTFLHLVDEDTEKSLQKDGDKLLKIRSLNDCVQQKCKQLYQPNREVSIDERMVRSKARFSFHQYIKNKPTKWGFKLWCLCDSRNGYTSAFSVYRGKRGEVRSGNGLSYDVVVSLMKPYYLQGYSLYIDNFYTSPTLVTDLYKDIHCTGTLDCTRRGVPAQVHALKKDLSKKKCASGQRSLCSGWYLCIYSMERY